MTGVRKRILYVLIGVLAGTITWGAQELLLALTVGYLLLAVAQGAVLGLIFGYSFGAVEGIAMSEPRKAALTGLLSAGIGAVAAAVATVGVSAGLIAVANSAGAQQSANVSIFLPISRVLAWAIVGAVVAAVEGVRTLAWRRTLAGLVGGFAGGLLGGLALEHLIRGIENQSLGRAVGFVLLGIGVGFFLGEFERRFSFARLRIVSGPQKNKEFVLSRRRSRLGSGMTSEVYIKLYERVEARHAQILESGGDMRITTSHEVRVNEKPVRGERYLKYHDVLELGSVRMLLLPA